MNNDVKPNAVRTHRKIEAQELFALTAANQFWGTYVIEHHETAGGPETCHADLDLDELEVELDVFLKKAHRRGRQINDTAEHGGDNPIAAVLRQLTGANNEIGTIAADEETWAMARAYVIAFAKAVLNARKE